MLPGVGGQLRLCIALPYHILKVSQFLNTDCVGNLYAKPNLNRFGCMPPLLFCCGDVLIVILFPGIVEPPPCP